MSGTMMLLAEAGHSLHYMNLANGCCGSTQHDAETIAAIRREEAQQAAAAIGAVFHGSICNDLEIFYNLDLLQQVASVIREVEPGILLVHSPSDYMEDHMNACRLAVTAAFSRGMPNFPVQPPRDAVSGAVTVYHAQPYSHRDPLGHLVLPEYYVDISSLGERKQAMLACHSSQKQWLDESQGLDSYLHTMQQLDEELGAHSGVFSAAEGWRRHLHLGFCEAQDDPLMASIGQRIHPAGESACTAECCHRY